MTILICMIVFAVLYAIKGGSGNVLKNWNRVRDKNALLGWLLDGKVLSTLAVYIFTLAITVNGFTALFVAIAWLLAVSPSIGEEHGAIGRYGRAWGDYIEKDFGRMYGVKKGVQRGVFMGACMAFATGFIWFIPASLLFVPMVYIGQEINYRVMKSDGWTLAEPLIGAAVFGIPFSFWVN